jgi:competence protein ComEC
MRLFAPGLLLGVALWFCVAVVSIAWLFVGFVLLFKVVRQRAFLVGVLAGFCWTLVYMHVFVVKPIPHQLEKQKMWITGRVVSVPNVTPAVTRFLMQTTIKGVNRRLKLNWYYADKRVLPGDTWRLKVSLKQPHGLHNPGGFNAERYAFSQQITAAGYVVKNADNHLIAHARFSQLINRVRDFMALHLLSASKDLPCQRFLVALSLGIKQGFTPDDWQVLQNTGTSHLLAISGLHVGFVAGVVMLLFGWCWRRSLRLMNRLATPRASAIAGLLAALTYSAMAGFSIPTVRALVMLSVVLFAVIVKRQVLAWQALATAIVILIVLNPLSILSIGFWLSCAAVAIIAYAIFGRTTETSKWRQGARIQLYITVGLLPMTIWFFHKASVISPLANVVAIPWVGLIVVPLSLLGCLLSLINVHLAHGVLFLAAYSMQGAWWYLQSLSHWSFSAINFTLTSPWELVCFILGVILLLAPRGLPGKWFVPILLLPLFFPRIQTIPEGEFRFYMLDVGQGLASIVQTQHHALVYDTGPKFPTGFDAGQSVVTPVLRYLKIKKLDMLMVSHLDNDHVGGALSVTENVHPSVSLTSDPKVYPAGPATACYRGEHWIYDGVRFQVLWPIKGTPYLKNNSSCVLKVTAQNGQSLLLLGDLEKPGEIALIRRHTPLKAQVLVAPHHGSKTSSSAPFVKAVHPEFILYPIGYLNRFHFPSKAVMARYDAIGAKVYRSDQNGMVSCSLGGQKVHCSAWLNKT